MINKGMFTNDTSEWETPQDLFDQLDREFHFTLDPCSSDDNAKCVKHYTKEQDGLKQDWTGEVVFCNPPYGREQVEWVKKCYRHFTEGGGSSDVDPGKDGHKDLSRLHPASFGSTVYQRSAAILRRGRKCPVPINDRDIQRS